jgi:hypothetical protein
MWLLVSGCRTDDPGRGAHAEVLEKVGLAPRPCEQLIQPARVEALVGLGQDPECPPARGLAFHAQPQDLQLFQAAERRTGQEVAVELQPGGLLADPRGPDLVRTDRYAKPPG